MKNPTKGRAVPDLLLQEQSKPFKQSNALDPHQVIDMKIHQIVYSSLASKKMLKSDLFIILRKARLNNRMSEITGILIYIDGYFLQILEGNKDEVHKIFNKISQDPRHTNCQVIFEGDTDKRFFPRWEMAYASPSLKDLSMWSGLRNTASVESAFAQIKAAPKYISDICNNVITVSMSE